MDIFVNKNYDFIKWRFTGVIFSLAITSATSPFPDADPHWGTSIP